MDEQEGDEIVLIVNNLGGTSILEMNCVMKYVVEILRGKYKVQIVRVIEGQVMTSLDMKGVSLTFLHLLKEYSQLFLNGYDLLILFLFLFILILILIFIFFILIWIYESLSQL